LGDQREANAQMVRATIRAQELTEEAEAAQARAEMMANALRESEERYSALFAAAPVAIFVCDRNAVIQQYNRHAVELWGREPARGVERHCGSVKLWLPDGAALPHSQSPLVDVLRTGIPMLNVEVFVERPDGSRLPVLVNFAPLRDGRGEVSGAVTSFVDISERKRAEKQLTEALSHERSLAEFREMFIGILGHDLRNPLGSIVMASALLLRRGHLDDQDAETAGRIIRSGQRMTRMIAQLLDLTRARIGGGLPIEPKPTDLSEICRNVIEELESPIHLEVEGDVTGIWDQDRLAEAVSNLAANAIAYAAPETTAIVKAHGEGAEVIVEVSNQGDPIPAELLPHIFEPFRQAREGQRSTGHLGLGLYIACQIVRAHGGTLEAQSAGGTTTFAMRLPRRATRK
jgi:PAS domain S-box-containing protein